jgi:hypothetical protein
MRRIAVAILLASLMPAQSPQPALAFSEVMRELSANPRFVEAFLARLDKNPAAGVLLGPENIKLLRTILFGKEWQRLDTFPGVSLTNLGRGVWVAGKTMAKPVPAEPDVVPQDDELLLPVREEAPEPLAEPEDLGFELTWGDLPDPALQKMRASGLRLAEVMNRLAWHGEDGYRVRTPVGAASHPAELLTLLAKQGFQATVTDARYFANFGDLRFRNQDVATPFWIDTGIRVPRADRTLLVPATHSQTELRLERNGLAAVIAFYFGIDGKAAWRVLDTADQSWVGARRFHVWEGERARQAVQSVANVMRFFRQAQQAYPGLPFGGYHALGVCNDASALVEQQMEGRTTLFPLVADRRYFEHIPEAKKLLAALPADRTGVTARDLPRIADSLPFAAPASIPLPRLREDMQAALAAHQAGTLDSSTRRYWLLAAATAALALFAWWLRRFRRAP